MISAFIALGLPRDSTDEEVRERYLELVRANPPGRDPERFQRVVAAYEAVKTVRRRVDAMLFGAVEYDSFDDVVNDLEQAAVRKPESPGLRDLIDAEGLSS